MPRHYALAIVIMAGFSGQRWNDARADEPQVYEVYAVRYGVLRGCPVSALVQGADRERKVDLAMMFWVLKGANGRIILVDAGLYRPKTVQGYGVADYQQPDRALARLSIDPEQVTDLIITHMHSDHAEGADLFPKAQIWIQKTEYDQTVDASEKAASKDGRPLPDHVAALKTLKGQGRVHLVDGDAKEILPGVTVFTGGKHTFESQYVVVNTRSGRMVVASDNVYLYENLDKHVPIAVTLDAKANLAAQDRMRQLAAKPGMIIPGHDPEVFVKFPKPGNGVARLD
jgi:glyoxylase-like metal-dependent hydrolase (beta-lactamase superfamily II)